MAGLFAVLLRSTRARLDLVAQGRSRTQERYVWKIVRRLVKKKFPDDESMHLPPQRYKRYHYEYFREAYFTKPEFLEHMQGAHGEVAAEQALELGLMDPDGEGGFARPSLDQLMYSDGKVVTPPYRAKSGETRVDRETGEIKALRAEQDAGLHLPSRSLLVRGAFDGPREIEDGSRWQGFVACWRQAQRGPLLLSG